MHAWDAVIEIFTWLGFGGAVVLGILAVILWAADGTWLAAGAVLDAEDGEIVARWFDHDGEANSAVLSDADAAVVAGRDRVDLWYRLGWQGRARLTRRAPVVRALLIATWSLLALGIVALVTSWVVMFATA